MVTKRRALSSMVASMLLSWCAVGHAGQLILPVAAFAKTSDGSGGALVLQFDELEKLAGKDILYAKCQLTIQADSCGEVRPELIATPVREPINLLDAGSMSRLDSAARESSEPLAVVVDVQIDKDGLVELMLTEFMREAVLSELSTFTLVLAPTEASMDCVLAVSTTANTVDRSGGKLIVKYADREK